MIRRVDPDMAALRILLGRGTEAQKQAKLTKLARDVRGCLEGTFPCPECGDEGPHEWNGSNRDPWVLCKCGEQFQAPEVEVAL